MTKTEVYSWRLSPQTKAALEREARRESVSLAALLERITQEWLAEQRAENGSDASEQARLHRTAAATFGTIAGGNPHRAEAAKQTIRDTLKRRHDRSRTH
ncbi:MAG TPA: hypothetical protein VML01_05205 [Bryobacterales bacterium]|nr:hypothetical protein [Bryobacterales bacterium]